MFADGVQAHIILFEYHSLIMTFRTDLRLELSDLTTLTLDLATWEQAAIDEIVRHIIMHE